MYQTLYGAGFKITRAQERISLGLVLHDLFVHKDGVLIKTVSVENLRNFSFYVPKDSGTLYLKVDQYDVEKSTMVKLV